MISELPKERISKISTKYFRNSTLKASHLADLPVPDIVCDQSEFEVNFEYLAK